MGKKIDTDAIQSELSGSAFFSNPQPQQIEKTTSAFEPKPSLKKPSKADVTPPSPISGQLPINEPLNRRLEEDTQPVVTEPDYNQDTTEKTNVSTNERSYDRKEIRHTFDILEDQLLSLRGIANDRTNDDPKHKKVLLGDLVQEALDMFIRKERNKN